MGFNYSHHGIYTYRKLVAIRPIGMSPSTSDPKKNSFVLSQLGGTINYKRQKRSVELFGKELANIVIPFNNDQLQFLLQNSDVWQVALIDFRGQILFYLPSSPILHFLKKHSVIFLRKFSFLFFSFLFLLSLLPHGLQPTRLLSVHGIFPEGILEWVAISFSMRKFSIQPLEGAILVFTDGSSNGKAVTIIDGKSHVQVTEETSVQTAELRVVIWAFQHLRDRTFNLLTDS